MDDRWVERDGKEEGQGVRLEVEQSGEMVDPLGGWLGNDKPRSVGDVLTPRLMLPIHDQSVRCHP